VAPAVSRVDWQDGSYAETSGFEAALAPGARAVLAELWQKDALMEHAAVASFARFSLQLLGLAAPAELVAAAHTAALDEVKHARACFGVASRFAGAARGPGALPELPSDLECDLLQALVATIHEGCVGETLSAIVVEERARVAGDEHIKATMLEIAADEVRHAELAWQFVAWALDGGGGAFDGEVRDAFELALTRAARVALGLRSPPAARGAAGEAPVSDFLLHHFGRLSDAEQGSLHLQAINEVLRPAVAALLEAGRAPSQAPLQMPGLGEPLAT
jgi:hypothetical protein